MARNRKRRAHSVWPAALLFMAFILPAVAGSVQAPDTRSKAQPVPYTWTPKSIRRVRHYAKPLEHYHPPHKVKVWTAAYGGATFRVTQLPRCEHLQMVISYNPNGETLGQAKRRMGGVAACTGSFHHPRSMALADFLQRQGSLISSARTGRPFVASYADGQVAISTDYAFVKRKEGVSALALGQRLVPLERNGFSTAFMNRFTDRMALGMNRYFIFIVQGRSDIWRLSKFMSRKLPVLKAVNSDGGHVVRGRAPVHLVFRWKGSEAVSYASYKVRPKQTRQKGS